MFKLFEFYNLCCLSFDLILEVLEVSNKEDKIEHEEALKEFELQGGTFDAYIDYFNTIFRQMYYKKVLLKKLFLIFLVTCLENFEKVFLK